MKIPKRCLREPMLFLDLTVDNNLVLCQEPLIQWRTIGLPHFSFRELKNSGKYENFFGNYEEFSFPSEEIPSIIGFKGIPDGSEIHNGCKMIPNANRFMKSDDTKAFYGEFPTDLCAVKHLIFIYTKIIEYQYVGDTKAPLLRVIDSKQLLKNGKLLTNTTQSISIELRAETGQLELERLF